MNRFYFFLLVFLLGTSSTTLAQEINLYLGEKDAIKATEAMAKDLNLTVKQKEEVLEVNSSYFKSFAEIEESDEFNPDERIREIVRITEDKDKKLSMLLDPNQMVEYDNKHHEARAYGFKKITREVQALRDDIQIYFDEHIRPALIKHRNALDGHLKSEEKKEVRQIREELRTIKMRISNANRRITAEIIHGIPVPKSEKAVYDSLLILEDSLFARAELIAQGYVEEIKGVLLQIELHQNKWHDELENIIGKHAAASADEYINPAHFLHVKTKYLEAGFLLFDPDIEVFHTPIKYPDHVKREELLISASISPNPSGQVNMLDFTVHTDGEVTVDQHNKNGTFRQHIFSGHVDSGHYSIKVRLEGVPDGSYFYVIKTGNKAHMERFQVRK